MMYRADGHGTDDRRHGLDHRLEALAGREEPEAQDDRLALQAQAGLDRVGCDQRQIGDAMGDDFDPRGVHAVVAGQQIGGGLRHDHRRPRDVHELG